MTNRGCFGAGLLFVILAACSGPDTTTGGVPIDLPAVEIEGELPSGVADEANDAKDANDTGASASESESESESNSECPHDEVVLPDVTKARPPTNGDVLVWFQDRADTTLRIDGVTGEVVGTEKGNAIFAAGTTWRFETTTSPTPRDRCPDDFEGSPAYSFAWTAELVSADARVAIAESHRATPDIEVAGYAVLRAAVGPIVFVDVTQHWSRCNVAGRHDETRVVAFDLERRAFVDLTRGTSGWGDARRRAAEQIGEYAHGPEIERAIVPRFTDEGLSFSRVLSWNTQPEGWDVLLGPVELEPERGLVPSAVAAYAAVPDGLRAFRTANPELSVGGFSVVRHQR